jgi:peptidoglycan/LPS O-acetylase OafA/YrhL
LSTLDSSLNYYPIWAAFGIVIVIVCVAATPLFRPADSPPGTQTNRVAVLDGLRGFLALSVVLSHVAVYYNFLEHSVWLPPPTRFYGQLGQIGVAVFFMVTSFLFWGRLIRKQGRPGWVELYINRLFRIAPLYVFAISVMLLFVAVLTNFTLNVAWPELARQVAVWLLGLGYLPGVVVNGYPSTGLLLAGVTWTIRFEWLFYLSLPILALATRNRKTHLPVAVIGLLTTLLGNAIYHQGKSANLFFCGMVCASLREEGLAATLPDWLSSATVAALIAAVLQFPDIKTQVPVLLLASAFYLTISGASFFGLFLTRPAQRLGNISFGIYLLQGLALWAVFDVPSIKYFALSSPLHFWGIGLLSMLLLISFATLTHALIERPGVLLGTSVNRMIRRRLELSMSAATST